MQRKSKSLIISITMFLLFSCSTWNNKSWENLTDRKFYFSEFFIFMKGGNETEIFKLMKNFPLYKLLKIISHKYNIEIDSSDFNDFIIMEDESRIKVGGLLGKSDFTWEMKEKPNNSIEIEYWYKVNDRDLSMEREYRIYINVDGKTRASFIGKYADSIPDLVVIAKHMNYVRVNKNNDNIYINTDNNLKVDLSTAEEDMKTLIKKEDKLSKPEFKKLLKDYIDDMPKKERKEFRDDLIKFLYKVVE